MSDYGIVIVGAGEAGARAAVELRTQGWSGPLTMIGDECWQPYERPPLSKQQLYADDEPQPVTIMDNAKLKAYGIKPLFGQAAVRIDRKTHSIALASGMQVPYERLLLATGAHPRPLQVQGSGAGDMLYLRNFTDAVKLRERLQPDKHIVIIGGGFIGLEVAASARRKNCKVTLIEVAPRILMRGVPKEIADKVEERHRNEGVQFKVGIRIESVDRSGNGYTVALAGGTQVECDVILVGIGAIPETALAAGCGLDIDNGVRANEYLATSDSDIYAAGDCCSFPHPLYGGRRIRLEAWRNAQDQGTHVAANMLGSSISYAAIPWFWSDQYEQTLQVTGLTDGSESTVLRDLGQAGQLYFHLSPEGRLVSASGIGSGGGIAKDIRLAEMLIENRASPDPVALSNPAIKLKELLRSAQ